MQRPFTPRLMIAGTRDQLDEQTLGVIERRRAVQFYPTAYARPGTVLVVSVILGVILLGFAGVILWALAARPNDVGSTIFYIILIAACLGVCAACVRWFLRSKKRARSRETGDLWDGIYVGDNFIIFYNSDKQIHVVPKDAFAQLSTARIVSTSGNRPHQRRPAFAVRDESGKLHWYVYMSYTPPQADFGALLTEWGVPDDGQEIIIHDAPDDYYSV
jgi:hypothetical protein